MSDITVKRGTTESSVTVVLGAGPVAPDYRSKINTPLVFLNHMIEHIVYRSGFNISAEVSLDKFNLSHVVCEDTGLTLGRAVLEYISRNSASGYGYAVGIIDEAKVDCAISFESRAYLDFTTGVKIPDSVEGMPSEDILTFLEGFVQGANCTLHLDIQKGKNAHHIWEAAFRALGISLKYAMGVDAARPNKTSGVAGNIEYIIK